MVGAMDQGHFLGLVAQDVCHRLKVCAPQIHILKPNPQCDGAKRWGL